MLILFDNNVPKPLRRSLPGHYVRTAYELGWANLRNGVLLAAAEQARFDLFITGDQNLEYQQNLSGRAISLIVLGACRWSVLLPHRDRIVVAANEAKPGSYAFIDVPLPPRPKRIASKPLTSDNDT